MNFTRVIAAALLLLLAACDKTPVPPMVFGASLWPGVEPVYLAREQGYFAGINVRLAEYGTVSEVKKALLGHELHAAALPLDEALLLRQNIPDLKIVLLLDARTLPPADGSPAQEKIFDALVVRDDDLGKYHGELTLLVRAWQRSLDFIHAQPEKSMLSMAQHEKADPAQFAKAMQEVELLGLPRNRELMLGEAPGLSKTLDVVQRSLLGRGLISMGADANVLLDTTLIPEK